MSNDYNRKIRFGVIAEDNANVNYDTNPNSHTLYIDNENHLAVKRDNAGKSWNIKDAIKNGLREEYSQNAQGNKQIYGFKMNMNEADPMSAIEYIHDNVGYTAISFTDLRSACDYGSWGDFVRKFIGCRPVALYEDGTVYRYLDENDYSKDVDGNDIPIEIGRNIDPTGKIYNVMVEFSQKWYHLYTDQNGYLYFEIANYKVNDDWCTDAFLGPDGKPKEYLYMSAYFTQRQYIGEKELFSSLSYKVSKTENISSVWEKNNFYKLEKAFEKQNKYMYGYSQFIYFRMLMILICKTVLIGSPYGVMDPLNSVGKYVTKEEEREKLLYSAGDNIFLTYVQNNSSRLHGLMYLDKDANDINKNTGNKTTIVEKIFGIDGLFSVGGEFMYGFGCAYNKKDIYYKPNPPYYFNSNIDQDLLNKTFKYHLEYQYSEIEHMWSKPCKSLKAIGNIILPGDYTKYGDKYTYSNSYFGLPVCNDIGSSNIGDILSYPFAVWYFWNGTGNKPFLITLVDKHPCNIDNEGFGFLKRFIQFSN